MIWKRVALTAGVVVSLVFGSAGAAAADPSATIETTPVNWEMHSATSLEEPGCTQLPSGTTVTGTGEKKVITIERTDRKGVTTVLITEHAFGTASDQDGNVYRWNYINHSQISNSIGNLGLYTGTMLDRFSLGGSGPARLSTGFTADIITDGGDRFEIHATHVIGDPIAFFPEEFEFRCDPL